MKKIMIIAAVMLTAAVANAAMFKWSASNIYVYNSTEGYAYTTADKFTGNVDLYLVSTTGDILVSTVKASSGVVTGTEISDSFFTVGNSYSFYLTLTTDDGMTFKATPQKDSYVAPSVGTTTIAFGNMTSTSQSASNWTGEAVPEPTSGLLLLCGLAGLALRRKRA